MAVSTLDDAFELRILSGLHKGARAALLAGQTVVVGSDADCDFILRDSTIPARLLQLQQQGGAWVLQWLTGAGEADTSQQVLLPKDKAVSLAARSNSNGPETPVLAIQPVHMPWPKVLPALITQVFHSATNPMADNSSAQAVPNAVNAGSHDKNKVVAAAGLAAASQILPEGQSERPHTLPTDAAQPASLAQSVLKKPVQWLASLLLVLMAVVLLGYLAFGWFKQTASTQTALAPGLSGRGPSVDPSSLNASRAAITAIAAELKLLPRVRIEAAENGQSGWLVRAGPLTDDETEALSAALSRLSPRPGLRVVSEFALREAVQEAVARHSAARGTVLKVSPLTLGRFQIQGRLLDNADRDAVLAALQTEFAGTAVFESALQTSSEVAAQMVTELQKTGIASVQGQWQAGKLVLQAHMPKASLPAWEASLTRIAARYALPFTATLSWTADARAASSTNPGRQTSLPFALQSIVGGPTPYVVTADGGKLLPGGSYQGWKLVDISAQRALFEATQGAKRVEVRR